MRAARAYLLGLVTLGVGIHCANLLGVGFSDVSRWLDWVMLGADLTVLGGLASRRRWGLWAALALFAQQVVFQSYWTYGAIRGGGDLWYLQGLTALLCWIGLACVLALLRGSRRPRAGS